MGRMGPMSARKWDERSGIHHDPPSRDRYGGQEITKGPAILRDAARAAHEVDGTPGRRFYSDFLGGGGDMGSKLDRLCALMEKQIATTAAVPRGVTQGVGAALGGAAQSASFSNRYPH